MKFTKAQLKKYLAGELKIVTKRSTGKQRLVPAGKNPLDKGVTKPEKRAYYRLWYMKNKKKREAYRKKYYAKIKRVKLLHPEPLQWATTDVVRTTKHPSRQPRSLLRRLAEWLVG